jgi:hypothetical protein
VEFNDENKAGLTNGAGFEKLDRPLSGDFFDIVAIIGMNF